MKDAKTTLELNAALLQRAKRYAKRVGRPLRYVVEDGLRALLETSERTYTHVPRDLRAGKAGDPDPLKGMPHDVWLEHIYGSRP